MNNLKTLTVCKIGSVNINNRNIVTIFNNNSTNCQFLSLCLVPLATRCYTSVSSSAPLSFCTIWRHLVYVPTRTLPYHLDYGPNRQSVQQSVSPSSSAHRPHALLVFLLTFFQSSIYHLFAFQTVNTIHHVPHSALLLSINLFSNLIVPVLSSFQHVTYNTLLLASYYRSCQIPHDPVCFPVNQGVP